MVDEFRIYNIDPNGLILGLIVAVNTLINPNGLI